jgi:hypothetical protein
VLERFVVIDLNQRVAHLNPVDLVQSQSMFIPNGSRLVSALRTSAEAILKFYRKIKRSKVRNLVISPIQLEKMPGARSISPSPLASLNLPARNLVSPINTNDGHDLNPPTDPMVAVDPSKINTPIELDNSNPDCTSFLLSIKQFTSTFSNHILAVLNTTIHLQQLEKEAARAKRRVVSKNPNLMNKLKGKSTNPIQSTVSPAPLSSISMDVGVGSFDPEDGLPHKAKGPNQNSKFIIQS